MREGNTFNLSKLIVVISMLIFLLLNIISFVLELSIYASKEFRIGATIIIILCNGLIYIFIKDRPCTWMVLGYWIFLYSIVFNLVRIISSSFSFLLSASYLFYFPDIISIGGLLVNSGTLLFIFTSIIFIALYTYKVYKQKRNS